MSLPSDPIAREKMLQALQEALALSPENIPLKVHIADIFLQAEKFAEAEKHYRELLALDNQNHNYQAGLARAFQGQGKRREALVLTESLIRHPEAPASAFLLHSRLLYQDGEIRQAVEAYKRAVALDPAQADLELAVRLGVGIDSAQSEVVEGKVRAASDDGPVEMSDTVERPEINFSDVGGMEALKEEIRIKIIHPINHPEIYKAYGKSAGGGILMYGPPGCGKTYLARATAGEIKASFISVGINDVLDMWIGTSERNLHELFERARLHAPCVLFFDEVDALGASRADMRHHAGRQLINQFLAEFDGVKTSNEGILIMGATNAPWHLDAAFRRPGRFDRVLFVPPPDASARESILRLHSRNKPAESLDFSSIVKKTEHFSGADLKAVVDLAVECKLREALRSGGLQPLATKDLLAACAQLRPTTKEWFSTAKNYALYSNQGGAYDDILKYLKI